MADGKAVLAYVVSDSVSYSWHRSMMGLVAYDSGEAGRLRDGGGFLAIKYGTGGLIHARNQAPAPKAAAKKAPAKKARAKRKAER